MSTFLPDLYIYICISLKHFDDKNIVVMKKVIKKCKYKRYKYCKKEGISKKHFSNIILFFNKMNNRNCIYKRKKPDLQLNWTCYIPQKIFAVKY